MVSSRAGTVLVFDQRLSGSAGFVGELIERERVDEGCGTRKAPPPALSSRGSGRSNEQCRWPYQLMSQRDMPLWTAVGRIDRGWPGLR
jgi:hypothetical protein